MPTEHWFSVRAFFACILQQTENNFQKKENSNYIQYISGNQNIIDPLEKNGINVKWEV